MSRKYDKLCGWLLAALVFITGCHPTQPFYFNEDGDLSHYIDRATEIEYPDVCTTPLEDVKGALAPFTLSHPEFKEFWDLKLEEAVSIALQNSKVIRDFGQAAAQGTSSLAGADQFLRNPAGSATVYDPAINETAIGGGRVGPDRGTGGNGAAAVSLPGRTVAQQVGGVADALAEFDAQFFTSVFYSKTDRPLTNNPNFQQGQSILGRVSKSETANINSTLRKKTASGGNWVVRHLTTYSHPMITNIGEMDPMMPSTVDLQSTWTTAFEVEVQHPLLQGYGVQVNRIPIILARINTDITLANFEGRVMNLVQDVENAYWDLYLAYRNLATAKTARDSALETWRLIYQRVPALATQQEEAQAREQYYNFRSQVEGALAGASIPRTFNDVGLFEAEQTLRYLMGIAPTDGRLIRPIDEPTVARVSFDWSHALNEALIRSPNLRQQKWAVKQRELELVSARNLLLPQLNATALYRWVGVGDRLIGDDIDFPAPGSGAVAELTEGKYQESSLGFEFIPHRFGSRRELSAVRNAQLSLAREKARLEDMELNVSHLLSKAMRDLDSHYHQAQTQFMRWVAAHEEVEARNAVVRVGKQTVEFVLDAQRRRAQAQASYHGAVVQYNKLIAFIHFRKGSLLEYNGVYLAEGPWPNPAYADALRHARRRDASYYFDYGWTRPKVVSTGPTAQHAGEMIVPPSGQQSVEPVPPGPEAEGAEAATPPARGDGPDLMTPPALSDPPALEEIEIPLGPPLEARPARQLTPRPGDAIDHDVELNWPGLQAASESNGESEGGQIRQVSWQTSSGDGGEIASGGNAQAPPQRLAPADASAIPSTATAGRPSKSIVASGAGRSSGLTWLGGAISILLLTSVIARRRRRRAAAQWLVHLKD